MLYAIGTFYLTVGNLPPERRSQLSSIHLVALVKASFIGKYGMDSVLKPFVTDVKKLVSYSFINSFYINFCIGKRSGDDNIWPEKNNLWYACSSIS